MKKTATGLTSIPISAVPGSENVESEKMDAEDVEAANKGGFNQMAPEGFDKDLEFMKKKMKKKASIYFTDLDAVKDAAEKLSIEVPGTEDPEQIFQFFIKDIALSRDLYYGWGDYPKSAPQSIKRKLVEFWENKWSNSQEATAGEYKSLLIEYIGWFYNWLQSTVTGAVGGAVAGAAIGGVPTGGAGAPIGAGVGAVVGGVAGAYASQWDDSEILNVVEFFNALVGYKKSYTKGGSKPQPVSKGAGETSEAAGDTGSSAPILTSVEPIKYEPGTMLKDVSDKYTYKVVSDTEIVIYLPNGSEVTVTPDNAGSHRVDWPTFVSNLNDTSKTVKTANYNFNINKVSKDMRDELIKLNSALNGLGYNNLIKVAVTNIYIADENYKTNSLDLESYPPVPSESEAAYIARIKNKVSALASHLVNPNDPKISNFYNLKMTKYTDMTVAVVKEAERLGLDPNFTYSSWENIYDAVAASGNPPYELDSELKRKIEEAFNTGYGKRTSGNKEGDSNRGKASGSTGTRQKYTTNTWEAYLAKDTSSDQSRHKIKEMWEEINRKDPSTYYDASYGSYRNWWLANGSNLDPHGVIDRFTKMLKDIAAVSATTSATGAEIDNTQLILYLTKPFAAGELKNRDALFSTLTSFVKTNPSNKRYLESDTASQLLDIPKWKSPIINAYNLDNADGLLPIKLSKAQGVDLGTATTSGVTGATAPTGAVTSGRAVQSVNGRPAISIGTATKDQIYLFVDKLKDNKPEMIKFDNKTGTTSTLDKLGPNETRAIIRELERSSVEQKKKSALITYFKDARSTSGISGLFMGKGKKDRIRTTSSEGLESAFASTRQSRLDDLRKKGVI